MIPDKLYDVLKWIAILFLPALSTFVKVVFTTWNIPNGDEVAITITALATFLGAILGLSAIKYNQGNNSE